MAINLARGTRLFVSTVKTGNNNTNTWEVPVLNGYSFSQTTQEETIGLSESGCTVARGQRSYNTALDPVDVTFSTYIKPYKDGNSDSNAVERVLWEAFVGNQVPDAPLQNVIPGTPSMEIDFLGSNVPSLTELYLFFQLDNTTYLINNVQLNTATIDFDIAAIATIEWAGLGNTMEEVDTTAWMAGTDYMAEPAGVEFIRNKLSLIELFKNAKISTAGYQGVNYGGLLVPGDSHDYDGINTYTASVAVDGSAPTSLTIDSTTIGATVADVLTELNTQLTGLATTSIDSSGNLVIISDTTGAASSIMTVDGVAPLGIFEKLNFTEYRCVDPAIPGYDPGKQYFIPITGGSLVLDNTIEALVPEELGKVNLSVGSFVGTRNFTGTLTAYLNNCDSATGGLLNDLLADTTNTSNQFYMDIGLGACNSTPKVHFLIPYAKVGIPTVNVEDVISTEITFVAQGSDITQNNELTIEYYADLT